MKCANDKCINDPANSTQAVVVNADGDMACDENCRKEYENQKNEFFDNIGNDEYYQNWLKEPKAG